MIAAPLLAPGVNDTFSGPVVVAVQTGTAFTAVGAPGNVRTVRTAASVIVIPVVLVNTAR